MVTDRTIQILAVAGCVLSAFSLAPAQADACSPQAEQFDILPTDGEVVPSDVLLHVVSIWPPASSALTVELSDGDGNSVALDYYGYGDSYGEYGFERDHYVVSPAEPLTPGTYTLRSLNHNWTVRTSTFDVSEELTYPAPPSVTSVEWHTRVFDDIQPAQHSCQIEFQQQSRITFERLDQGEQKRTLLYRVRFLAVGEFDGDIEQTEGLRSRSFLAVDKADGARFGENYNAKVEGDSVTISADTPFRAECVEITAIDITGQHGDTFVDCMPDRCAPGEPFERYEDWEWFQNIDWSVQPDCSLTYCYEDDCAEPPEDAGLQLTDAGIRPTDAGLPGHISLPNDTSDTSDVGGEDAAQADSSQNDASDTTDRNTESRGEGCTSTPGRVPPVGSAALALLLGLGVAVRARHSQSL